jgi:hypothetical protein
MRSDNLLTDYLRDVIAPGNISIIPKGRRSRFFDFLANHPCDPFIRRRMADKYLVILR